MTPWLLALIAVGVTLPHALRLNRSTPIAAAVIWSVGLALRALLVIFAVLYVAFFVPGTEEFTELTHWCWHTAVPIVADHLGLDGHHVGGAATILPGLVATVSLLSMSLGVVRGTRALRRLLARESLGPGPSDSVIVAGHEVMLAAAGLGRPQVVVSAGALLELDDEELAAGLATSVVTSRAGTGSCWSSRSSAAASGAPFRDAPMRVASCASTSNETPIAGLSGSGITPTRWQAPSARPPARRTRRTGRVPRSTVGAPASDWAN